MLCPQKTTPINRKSTKSRAAILLEEGMMGKAVSTGILSPTPFPAESGAGKKWQVFSHSAIQPGSYLYPGSPTPRPAISKTIQSLNLLNLHNLLYKIRRKITGVFVLSKSILHLCNLSLICVIKDFPEAGKSFIFFLTSKSTSGIIRNYLFKYLSMQY